MYTTPAAGNYRKLRAALSYARRGIPVFPCAPGGKAPLTERGFKNATTDKEQIREWWRDEPEANIGIPTGPASGIWALDVDADAYGFTSLDDLTRDHGELPRTTTVKTGRGGLHYLFAYPDDEDIRNNSGKLGVGLDVRGAGGYVIAPPSHTESSYEWLERIPLADAPAWLTQVLREPEKEHQEVVTTQTTRTTLPGDPGGLIPTGERNVRLTSIAGKLRARGYEYGELLAKLDRINETRCSEPLSRAEVEKIGRSVSRYGPGKAAPEVTPEVLAMCRDVEEHHLWGRRWPGLGGKSQRALLLTVLRHAVLYGERIPGGIRVSLSQRSASEDAGISRKAIRNAIKNLKPAGIMRIDPATKQGECSAFVLVPPPAQGVSTQPPGGDLKSEGVDSGYPLRATYSAARLRHAAPGIWRIGKGCEEFVDALELAGGSATVQEIAALIHHPRPRDLRRPGRVGKRLEEEGVVEWTGDTVSFTPHWREAWHRARVLGGEIEAAERDSVRHQRERERFRNRGGVVPEKAPTHDEMHDYRESYPARRREAIETAISRLFAERPEYKGRRTGQITCTLIDYLPLSFPRGSDGYPKDAEVEAILNGRMKAA